MASPSRRQNGSRPRSSFGRKVATFFGYVTTLVLIGALIGVGYGFVLMRDTLKSLPDTDALSDTMAGGATEIYATDKDPATGKNVVLGRVFTQHKEFAPITEIPEILQDATVAVEDERFYSHRGVDVRGIGRALYRDVRGGRMGEGGSTLTQQLARNVFLNQKKNFRRKIQEAVLAIQIEKSYSKEQILQMYLNEVCYGNNTYGVKAAAKMYFGKAPKQLTIAEAALIAGLPQSPTRYDPFDHLQAALTRRNTVLFKMREQGYITQDQYDAARDSKPKLIPEEKTHPADFKAPYFTNYVLRQLIARYGKDTVFHGGLKVYTTLNYQMQKEAEAAVANGVLDGKDDGVTEGALVSIEPRTGFIRAMVGGVDYKKNEFNNVTQGLGRQPGSSFKVFVYTAAFMLNPNKWNPDTDVPDNPRTFGHGRYAYTPHDDYGRYRGSVSIRSALTYSINVPAVNVAYDIGIQRVIDLAHQMGIRTKLSPDLSLALGSNAVKPIDMCSAYSVFANNGNHADPISYWKVVDGEGSVTELKTHTEMGVVPQSVVADMSSMLRDVVQRGTAAGAKDIQTIEDAHGKTGTTNDSRDAWFVGYTPELTTAVWVCGVQRKTVKGKTVVFYPPMAGVTGGHVCAPIWARFMKAAIPIQKQSGLEPQPPAEKVSAAREAEIRKALGRSSRDNDDPDNATDEATPRPRHKKNATPEPSAVDETPTPSPPAGPLPETAASPPPAPDKEPTGADGGTATPDKPQTDPEPAVAPKPPPADSPDTKPEGI